MQNNRMPLQQGKTEPGEFKPMHENRWFWCFMQE